MPNAAQVRKQFAEYVNRVAYGHERVLVERRGQPIVALIDMTDYQILLDHEGRQDRADLTEAAMVLAHPERHRWQTLDGTPVPAPASSRGAKKAEITVAAALRLSRRSGKVTKAGRR
jgi:prevent-host-death family protein